MANFELIKPSVERIDEKDNLKRIELAGRVCYKSEKKITDESTLDFCTKILQRGHTSVLEHSNVIVKVPYYIGGLILDAMTMYRLVSKKKSMLYVQTAPSGWVISGNMRAWYETLKIGSETFTFAGDPILDVNTCEDLTPYVVQECELTDAERQIHSRITLRITCDRGVSHEIVRHRVMSFSQESTRYVNYGKRGFVFVEPWWWDSGDNRRNEILLGSMDYSAKAYEALIADGASPQLARAVLPNMIKTEVVVTATPEQWEAFLRLRLSKAAHPDMQRVARLVLEALGDDVEVQDENH